LPEFLLQQMIASSAHIWVEVPRGPYMRGGWLMDIVLALAHESPPQFKWEACQSAD